MAKPNKSSGKAATSTGKQFANRRQPKADSRAKRVNYDNTRESKFERDMRIKDPACTNKSNDVRWYANSPELLKAAASLSFYNTVGLPLQMPNNRVVPGICTLEWTPVIGMGDNAPIQQAANSIYSFVVHANSRNYSYDPADQMMLILAGASVFSAIAMGIRAYGVMRRFSGQDYYTPAGLIHAMRFDYSNLLGNLSQMWFDLNEMIDRVSQIWVPNVMPVIERWFWMNSNVYKDAQSAKAQYYMFVPTQFYQLSETAEETGTSLQPIVWSGKFDGSSMHYFTWAEYTTIVRSMINSLLNSQDRGIIFGDILKAYGAEKLYSIKPITSDYILEPVYDREVLSQIENATKVPIYPGAITQDATGHILQNWNNYSLETLANTGMYLPNKAVLNFHQAEQPTPEQIMVATRLTALNMKVYEKNVDGSTISMRVGPAVCGTEIIFRVLGWAQAKQSDGTFKINPGALADIYTSQLNFATAALWASFDWCPWMYMLSGKTTTEIGNLNKGDEYSAGMSNMMGDWDNYTLVNRDEMYKLHLAAIYSEFGVPQM